VLNKLAPGFDSAGDAEGVPETAKPGSGESGMSDAVRKLH